MKIFIDPGLGGTGWATFDIEDDYRLIDSGVVRFDKNAFKDWTCKCFAIASAIDLLMMYVKSTVIEFPELWTSAKSMASANRGDLFKLAFLVGAIAEKINHTGYPVALISPADWKGQLPKDIVIKRILKEIPEMKKVRDHEADAIGMGLAEAGKL